MDFVLRDAYMSGYSQRSFDLDRLLHYSFFSEQGLTIHDRGMNALMRFMAARAELFRSIYFHRTVRAIDLTLADLFAESRDLIFPGNPLEHLEEYLDFTEWSLLVDVSRWHRVRRPANAAAWACVGSGCCAGRFPGRWWFSGHACLTRAMRSRAVFSAILGFVEQKIRDQLPDALRDLPLRVDIARHIERPHTRGPSGGQNFLYDSARDEVRPLNANELFSRLPTSQRICRIYANDGRARGGTGRGLWTR